jgi:hypothetical protein
MDREAELELLTHPEKWPHPGLLLIDEAGRTAIPSLTQRQAMPPPQLSVLPQLEESLHENAWQSKEQLASPYIDPDRIMSE